MRNIHIATFNAILNYIAKVFNLNGWNLINEILCSAGDEIIGAVDGKWKIRKFKIITSNFLLMNAIKLCDIFPCHKVSCLLWKLCFWCRDECRTNEAQFYGLLNFLLNHQEPLTFYRTSLNFQMIMQICIYLHTSHFNAMYINDAEIDEKSFKAIIIMCMNKKCKMQGEKGRKNTNPDWGIKYFTTWT